MESLEHLTDVAMHTLGLDMPSPHIWEILLALALSFTLQCIICLVYKSTFRGPNYSQSFVHMLLLMGTVVSVVIQAVKGDKATAFGMFAAFSILRFRHSLQQSRDIGFIFLAMGAGLGIGARLYLVTTCVILVACAVLYYFGQGNFYAARGLSHYLRIRVPNDLNYDTVFQECFDQFLTSWNMVAVQSVQAGMMTELRLTVSLRDQRKPGAFVSTIQQLNGNNRVLLSAATPVETSSD